MLRHYISGFYKKPKGLKKPYNPLLGELFRCCFVYPAKNGQPETRSFMVAEQVRALPGSH